MIKNWIFLMALVSKAFTSVIDVFEANGHEPRVMVRCGKIPYFVDVNTGHWVLDPAGNALCDSNKDDVKRYCQKVYGNLNITNIVEANAPVKFDQWCDPKTKSCGDPKEVVPYRCLVQDYEADALMVPKDCRFDHLHDETACMANADWKKRAAGSCNALDMNLSAYGILLPCSTDMFTGIEFVCCPRKKEGSKKEEKHEFRKIDTVALGKAIRVFQGYLPSETRGCDRTQYEGKRDKLEERHRKRIRAVVDEWDEAERRYRQLKKKDPHSAEEKMGRTLQVFRETLAALEEEAKEERVNLREDHARCINADIQKKKRDAIIEYIEAVEERPLKTKKILKTVRKFIQTCEHDRLHSLRHFEHVRNQDPLKAKAMRATLLTHLKELNNVVNISINLLSYLPQVAQQFGLTRASDGVVLKPMFKAPEIIKVEPHKHVNVPHVLTKKLPPTPEMIVVTPSKEVTPPNELVTSQPPLQDVVTVEPLDEVNFPSELAKSRPPASEVLKVEPHKDIEMENELDKTRPLPTRKAETTTNGKVKTEEHLHHFRHHKRHRARNGHHGNHKHRHQFRKGQRHRLTDNVNRVPKNKWMMEGTKQPVEPKPSHSEPEDKMPEATIKKVGPEGLKTQEKVLKEGLPEQEHGGHHVKDRSFFRRPRSPAAFAAVIGLSCGALVIMLGIIVALVMRRNRHNQSPRVVLTDAGDDDREHLVKMQKNGYENPTYKFFYN